MKLAISIKKLTKKYGNTTVLKEIDLEVKQGEIFALLGSNGAGKTTMLECIEGIRKYDSGEISVLGFSPESHEMRKVAGVQLQSTSLPANINAKEALTLFCKWQKVPVRLELLDIFGLKGCLNKQYKAMSTGQKRKLHLVLAVASNPKVIFLDEPTAGLDVEGRAALHNEIRRLKQGGMTVIMASHDMAEVEALCDRIAIIIEGKLAFIGTPAEMTFVGNNNSKISIKIANGLSKKDFKWSTFLSEENGYSIYSTTSISDSLLELLEYVKELKNEVLDLKIDRPTLEERFIEMMKGGKE
ncbi:MAG TPA: ABC transporter ATP-binding protein [Ruminiclostridium sp.]